MASATNRSKNCEQLAHSILYRCEQFGVDHHLFRLMVENVHWTEHGRVKNLTFRLLVDAAQRADGIRTDEENKRLAKGNREPKRKAKAKK